MKTGQFIFAWYKFWNGIILKLSKKQRRKRKNYFDGLEDSEFFKPLKSDN